MARRTPREWAVDALLFLLSIGFTAATLVDGTQLDAALGGLASLAVWLRRRWPIGFAVVCGLLSVYSVSASGVALIALFTVAVRRRAVVAIAVAAGFGLASFLTLLVRPDLPMPSWPMSLLGAVCVAAVLAWGMFVRSRQQLLRVRHEGALAEQELRIVQARQLERQRIAREMHDVLGHRLSLLSLQAGALQLWPDAPPGEIARAAGVVGETAHQALEDLRDVIGVLRAEGAEAPDRPLRTLADLPALVGESQHAGMRVVLECGVADLDAVPDAIGRTAYRIVQEGLTNARKHAPAADVSVSVNATAADGLTVEIRNPWPGGGDTPTIPGSGTGIIGLAERVGLAGGRLESGRADAGDFRLWAWLPWPA